MLRAPERLRGRRIACPHCGAKILISIHAGKSDEEPQPEPEPEPEPEPAAAIDFYEDTSLTGKAWEPSTSEPELPRPTVKIGKTVFHKEISKAEKKKKPPTTPLTRQEPKTTTPGKRGTGTLRGLRDALIFPLRVEALITIVVHAVLYGIIVGDGDRLKLVAAAALGIRTLVYTAVLTFGIMSYFGYFLFGVLRGNAQDDQDLPVATAFDFDEILGDGWLWFCSLFVGIIPLLVYCYAATTSGNPPGPIVAWLMVGFFFWYTPMAILSCALHVSGWAANPLTVLSSMAKIPLQYLATICFCAGLMLGSLILGMFVPSITIVSGIILWFLLFYSATAAMAALGQLYYQNRQKLAWFRESRPL